MYTIKFTSRFAKDLKRAAKRGHDLKLLQKVIDTLAAGKPLPVKYRDHALKGDYTGCRECHIEPDWLLIYQINNNVLVLTLLHTGTHSDLFKT